MGDGLEILKCKEGWEKGVILMSASVAIMRLSSVQRAVSYIILE